MAKGGALRKYRAIIESLGFKELDVYRVKKGSKEVDIIRAMELSTGKIVTIDLGTLRESLDYTEFYKKVIDELKKNGITLSERIISRVGKAVEELSKRYSVVKEPIKESEGTEINASQQQ